MTDAKAKADAYISRSGRLPGYGRDNFTEDLITAVHFLAWAEEDGAYYAGVEAGEAFRAMCRMLNFDPIALRKIAMGDAK